MREEMSELTKKLVQVASVNGTEGERDIAVYIEDYLRSIPYFKEHPKQVIIQPLKNDALDRRNVFALLKGEKDDNPNTVMLHGHTDTVGVEDYGAMQEVAFHPDELAKRLNGVELPREVKEDLDTGDYLFGRGACDMKSGVAVFMVMLRHIAEHVEELSGNILLSCNPVEENLHTGIIEGIDMLNALKEQYGLVYRLAINNDYTCPMYEGDKQHYIYTGVGGKLLPCFYIRGQETHVGQCFEGFDATMLAAKLVEKINLNPELCDEYKGEFTLPPVALKMKDLKTWYNVQTPKEALVYFNYFVHHASVEHIIAMLMEKAYAAVEDSIKTANENYRSFCVKTGKEITEIKRKCTCITYEKLYEAAAVKNKDLDSLLEEKTKEAEARGIDKREIPIAWIRTLLDIAEIYHPVIVLYFAAPYCPHNTLSDADEEIVEKIKQIAAEIEKEEHISYSVCRFFPSLSDSSYLAIDDADASVKTLQNNFPGMDTLYPLPLEKIKELGMKAVNFGVYGKDAHKWTERLYLPYSFETLPKLIEKTLTAFLRR